MTPLDSLVARPGPHSLPYRDPAFPDRTLHLHSACPAGFAPDTPVLFVHHGVGRNGAAYRDYWLPHVNAARLLVVSVEFPEAGFPDYLRYHFGNLHAEDGTPRPPIAWTYGIVPRLFDALRGQGITRRARYGLFGHSAGGQFVHRMLSFGYRGRVAAAFSANSGTYAMPDLEIPWPFGLGHPAITPAGLRDWLGFPLTVLAGTEDTRTTGRFFPKGPRSMRQGPTRYHRAHAYVEMGHAAAAALGTRCGWRVIDVPGVGHDGAGMSVAAVPLAAAALHAETVAAVP